MHRSMPGILLLLSAVPAFTGNDPRFTPENEVIRPANYREWVYLTSGLGMSYGVRTPEQRISPLSTMSSSSRPHTKLFWRPASWPDKTMFILEVRSSETHGSINKAGHFQKEMVAIEAAVKDEARFKEKWAYIDFSPGGDSARSGQALRRVTVPATCAMRKTRRWKIRLCSSTLLCWT